MREVTVASQANETLILQNNRNYDDPLVLRSDKSIMVMLNIRQRIPNLLTVSYFKICFSFSDINEQVAVFLATRT